eukprot:scaffold6683_cov58-Phaeocystis_antarctica.AAC.9
MAPGMAPGEVTTAAQLELEQLLDLLRPPSIPPSLDGAPLAHPVSCSLPMWGSLHEMSITDALRTGVGG